MTDKKTAAPDRSYIDYWCKPESHCCGIRVWDGRCQAITNEAEESPVEMRPYPEGPHSIPVDSKKLGMPMSVNTVLQIATKVRLYMKLHPDSDLLDVLTGEKSFAKALGPKGIVINAVAAGAVETSMLDTIPQARKDGMLRAAYLARFAQANEVAKVMYWLATDSPEYINGTCIDINNGVFPR